MANANNTKTSSLNTKNSFERATKPSKTIYKYFELIIFYFIYYFFDTNDLTTKFL